MINAEEIEEILVRMENPEQRKVLKGFFKTGKGQYGEGDEFLGIKVPQTRAVVKEVKLKVDFPEIEKLLYSKWHEVRLSGFLLLVEEMKACLPRKRMTDHDTSARREMIAKFYLRHARQANNWDLVDLSCEYILGPYIRLSDSPDYSILYRLAESDNLWEQRIAVVSTFDFIRNGNFSPTLVLADRLIGHPHDLIHKAVGWMLREIGKRDVGVLRDFLESRAGSLPRTALRYAIERLPEDERRRWMGR